MKETETIICSAVHFDDKKTYVHQPKNITSGFVVAGRRHGNCYTTAAILTAFQTMSTENKAKMEKLPEVQGFLTNKDRFVDRKEAWKIAKISKQINNSSKDGELHSEDLW